MKHNLVNIEDGRDAGIRAVKDLQIDTQLRGRREAYLLPLGAGLARKDRGKFRLHLGPGRRVILAWDVGELEPQAVDEQIVKLWFDRAPRSFSFLIGCGGRENFFSFSEDSYTAMNLPSLVLYVS